MSAEETGIWMWSRACQLLDETERRHRRMFELLSVPRRQPVWEPPADVFLLQDGLHIVVAMPGVRPENTAVELSASGLSIRAQSALPVTISSARIVRLEIPYGRIERRIELPPGRYRLLGHEFAEGCLHVRLSAEWS